MRHSHGRPVKYPSLVQMQQQVDYHLLRHMMPVFSLHQLLVCASYDCDGDSLVPQQCRASSHALQQVCYSSTPQCLAPQHRQSDAACLGDDATVPLLRSSDPGGSTEWH